MVDLGRRVRRIRREQELSQSALATAAGMALNSVNRIEKGHMNPSAESVARIAAALGVPVGALYEELETTTTGKVSAPPETGQSLLEKALDAARQDAQKTARAINRLAASEGTLPATHMTRFAEDEVRPELRAAGFTDTHFEEFIWPLVELAIEQEREISRLREEVSRLREEISRLEKAQPALESEAGDRGRV
jgi:transcriptional regulator with XRE-family HTH domain